MNKAYEKEKKQRQKTKDELDSVTKMAKKKLSEKQKLISDLINKNNSILDEFELCKFNSDEKGKDILTERQNKAKLEQQKLMYQQEL